MQRRSKSAFRRTGTQNLGPLLTEHKVADMLELSVRTLQRWRTKRWRKSHPESDWGPPFVRFGDRKKAPIRYPKRWVERWAEDRAAKTGSERLGLV